jgi:hypothetical protein
VVGQPVQPTAASASGGTRVHGTAGCARD